MKIVVIGNCQVRTVAACLRVLLPEDDVSEHWLESAVEGNSAALREALGGFDVVVAHPQMSGPLAVSALRERARRLFLIPQLVFTGFHPDDVVIAGIRGPLGHNHSAIVVSSFLLGLPQRRCTQLFNAYIYGLLGYFDRFALAKDRLLQRSAQLELPLHDHFDTWPRPFMYDVHHPRLAPLASVAEALACRITGSPVRADWSPGPVAESFDQKRFASWPVYPEIAARLGMAESEMRFAFPHTAKGLSLAEYVALSYTVYGTADRTILENAVEVEAPILRGLLGAGPGG